MQVMTGHQRLAGHNRTTLGLHYAPYRSERALGDGNKYAYEDVHDMTAIGMCSSF